MPERVKNVVSSMGRTEDAQFSPDGRFLAIAGFTLSEIHLFAIEVAGDSQSRTVNITACVTIHSNSLRRPHGIAFIDNEHMIVANREGRVHVFRIPANAMEHEFIHLQPIETLRSSLRGKVKSPGSIDCYDLGDGRFRVLACNNYIHTVTSHTGNMPQMAPDGNCKFKRISNDGVLIKKDLLVPDGICVSLDKKWLAISVHTSGNLQLYKLDQELNRRTQPACILEGTVCPHGIRFSWDGKILYSADAASPYLHLFYRRGDTWTSLPKPDKSIRIMSQIVFNQGRVNDEEGGLKGIDILHQENILAVTSEFQPLAFYELDRLQEIPGLDVEAEIREKSKLRDKAMAAYGW